MEEDPASSFGALLRIPARGGKGQRGRGLSPSAGVPSTMTLPPPPKETNFYKVKIV